MIGMCDCMLRYKSWRWPVQLLLQLYEPLEDLEYCHLLLQERKLIRKESPRFAILHKNTILRKLFRWNICFVILFCKVVVSLSTFISHIGSQMCNTSILVILWKIYWMIGKKIDRIFFIPKSNYKIQNRI